MQEPINGSQFLPVATDSVNRDAIVMSAQQFNELIQRLAPKKEPEFLTLEEAAEFIRLKPATLYNKTCRNKIPFIKKSGRLYFTTKELRAWMNEGTVSEVKKGQLIGNTRVTINI